MSWFLPLLACCIGVVCGCAQGALAAEEQSRLTVQAKPFPCVSVQAPDGTNVVALPFQAAARLAPPPSGGARKGVSSPVRAALLLLYGVPANLTAPQLSALSARLQSRFAVPFVLLAPTDAVFPGAASTVRTRRMRWLSYGKSVILPSGAVDVHVLPQDNQVRSRSLAIVHLRVPYMDVGIAYPVARQPVHARPPEQDVLIVDLGQLTVNDFSPRALSMLDPGMAVILDGSTRLSRQPDLTQFVDRLYEMWIDVYTVDSPVALTVIADPHGVFLPLHGRHA